MAKPTTLQDKVAAGAKVLAGQKSEPVQTLAAQQGLIAAPVTAYGTNLIGGSPEQAKMAGTPAQKSAAISQVAAPKGETQLEQEQKLGTATTTAEEENKKKLAGQYVQSLGTYGAKVNEWINAAKNTITGQQAQVQVDVSDPLLAGLDVGKKGEVIDLIKKAAVETDPAKKMQLELQLNTKLGRTASNPLSNVEKGQLYQDVASSIQTAVTAGREAVTGADRKVTLSDITTLGTSPQELAALLKVPIEEVNNYSLAQLSDKISQVKETEFGAAQAAQTGLAASSLSQADRAALRQYLRGIESTGVAGAEAGMASLAQQIDQNQSVQFAGKSFTVDELLASPAINDLFKTVLDEMSSAAGTGPNTEALKKNEPATYDWLTKNKSSVQGLIDQSVASTKSFGELQKANVSALGDIAQYQPQLATDMGFNPDELRAEKIDTTKLPGIFQAVGEIKDPGQRKIAAASLADLNDKAPKGELKDLTADQIKALQPGVVGGPADVYLKTADAVRAAQSKTYIDDVIKEFSSGDESLADLNSVYSDDNLAKLLDIPTSNVAELDTNHDGKIDQADAAGIKAKIGANLPSLSKLAAGEKPTSNLNSFKLSEPKAKDSTTQNIFNTIKTSLRDGSISEDEANSIRNLGFNEDQLKDMRNKNWNTVPGGKQVQAIFDKQLAAIVEARQAEAARRAEDEARQAEEARKQRAAQVAAEMEKSDTPQFFKTMEDVRQATIEAPKKVTTENIKKGVTRLLKKGLL